MRSLKSHRKRLHNYGNSSSPKKRGRPKKDDKHYNRIDYKNFFNKKKREKINHDNENLIINLDIKKDDLIKFFNNYKNKLFNNDDKLENYTFYKLIINNWEKEEPNLEKESLSENNNDFNEVTEKVKKTNLDGIFFLYLKDIFKKCNFDYFLFIIKVIFILREFINETRKNLVPKNNEVGKMTYYSEIYNAEVIPSICNNFLDYLSYNNYFDLDRNELIDIVQQLCYWLYNNHYSKSYLVLL